ncbi:MAG: M13 family metallopeptidase [Muribaculaceae bacterium]|nr:M13 family metallopeptidase [Muribaculaceae bacterium]
MKKISYAVLSIAFASTITMCTTNSPKGIDRANLNDSVAPQADFYEYACGGWMKANPLKPEYSRFGTFDQLAENTREQVKELITGLDTKNAVKGSPTQQIGDLYAMGMDSVRLNQEGATPVMKDIETINNTGREDLIDLMATMVGVDAFFGTGVDADMMNSDMNTMYWQQGGIGLGDRDYYLEDSENTIAIREAYKNYLKRITGLIGYDSIAQQRVVDNVMRIETALAKAAMSREELRDPAANYNPMTIEQIAKDYRNVDLRRYFAKQGIDSIGTVVIGQPKSLAAVNEIMGNESEEALRDYFTAGYLSSAANYLSDDFINANFELRKVISGVQQLQPRWKRALAVPNGMLGEAVGQLYVEKYFPQSSKDKMLKLVENLKIALGQHIDALTWMSDSTKAQAQEKLATFTVKIGFPDKWRDYSDMTIDPQKSYWENVQAAMKHENDFNLADYGKPVDKTRWYMPPQTVNAYYSPLSNEICFPAGILQPPFFDPNADDALNYGAIGVVIGHEMTHGFDDQGRQFDKDGNFKNWWAESDAVAFNALADMLVAQFDSVVVHDETNTHANGRFTLGENIADQGGLRVAMTAYKNSQKDAPAGIIDGFTPEQRFYLAYANVWAGNIRDEEILSRTKTDPHSLGRWRVNASLRNIEEFFNAFGIKEGDPMFRPADERVIIW